MKVISFVDIFYTLLNLVFHLCKINQLNSLVELLNISIVFMLLQVSKRFNHSHYILLITPFYRIKRLTQLKFIAINCIIHEASPIFTCNLVQIKLFLDLFTTVLNFFLICLYLNYNHFKILFK